MKTIGALFLSTMLASLLQVTEVTAGMFAQDSEPAVRELVGTVAGMNPTDPSVTIDVDHGTETFLSVTSPDVMEGLAIGDRVLIRMNEAGKIFQIVRQGSGRRESSRPGS